MLKKYNIQQEVMQMKKKQLCLFSYIKEKRNDNQLDLIEWLINNPSPVVKRQSPLKMYYEKEIHLGVELYFYLKNINGTSHMWHLVLNYPLPQKENGST